MKKIFLTLLPVLLFCSCQVISNFDQNSYNSSLALKSECASMVAKGVDSYEQHSSEVDSLNVKIAAEIAYEQGKGGKNVISAKQWEILLSEDHNLYGKFLKDWKAQETFSPDYLIEKQKQISDAFDEIIKLESAKQR